jgi:ABC-type multidrug transport system ATPase subunit
MTVEEHLYFYCRIKDIKTDYAQTIESIVNMLKIQDEYKKKVRELSGGNKRKVSIAIAVLGNP